MSRRCLISLVVVILVLLSTVPSSAEVTRSSAPRTTRGDVELLAEFLRGPMAEVEEIVFAERVAGTDHWYANFGFYAAPVPEYPLQRGIEGEKKLPCFGDGGRLCRLNLRTKKVDILLDDPRGGIRDPQVHYDGQKIVFSYRKGGDAYFHLYEINRDGSGLVQRTEGPYDDIEPAYLPDGGIVFVSSRCNRYVNCHRTPVATLYRCDGDGSHLRMLSTNIEHDNTPWVLPDGRILHMRWEYVDRSQFAFHHLWTMNPDGTGQMVYYGNQLNGVAMLDAKPIPGSPRVVASFSPGHGVPEHAGQLTVVDPKRGPDEASSARAVSRGSLIRDPYAFSEDCFLAVDAQGIIVMNGAGQREVIYRLPAEEKRLTCHEPRPLVPRPREPIIPSRVDLASATGRLYLSDVYHGRNMAEVPRGAIRKLLVLEQLPKPVNFSGGMWPISVGGTFTLARVLGTVPVEEDGSAFIEVPALRSLFFVALDENDLSVKRMQSFVSVQPGETTGCVGCHERRVTTPLAGLDHTILQRRPKAIEPIADVPDVLDFPRDIQPILDRHCGSCHNAERQEGGVNFCSDHAPLFNESYWAMNRHQLISDGQDEQGNRPPRSIGSSASRLLALTNGSHHGAMLSPLEQKTLRLWIDSGAVYAGTYAALGSGMHLVTFPLEVLERRCGECHGKKPPEKQIGRGMYFRFGMAGPHVPLASTFLDLQQIRGGIGYYKLGHARPPQSLCNLTRPEQSLLLRAPLATSAGGLGRCEPAVFTGSNDADYQAILAAIVAASQRHQEEKSFDMPGFVPNVYYTRKLQEYGILPADWDAQAPFDYYAMDRAYWRSFWYQPPQK